MKTAYINGIILDGTENMVPVSGKTIFVDDGKITKIADSKESTAGYEVVDLKNRYIMPGLINMHVHLALDGGPTKKPKKKEKKIDYKKLYDNITKFPIVVKIFRSRSIGYAKTQLLSGTTTLRTVGGIMDFDTYIRDNVKSGKLIGPRILASNSAISVPSGHFAGSLGSESKTPKEAVEDVKKVAKTNPDLIKIMITGGVMDCEVVGEPGIVKMPEEIIKASVETAHSLGFKVASHAESKEGVKLALKYGVDTIEHGGMPDDEMMEMFKNSKSALICTLSPALPYALFNKEVSYATEEAHINGTALFKGMIECAKKCLEAGIPVGLGNDCSCPFDNHYNFWRELVFFHNYVGVSNGFALYTATKKNAEIAGIDDITGSIEVGKAADFIVTEKNPLDDLSALRNVLMVVSNGKIYDKPKFKKMKKVDAELDKFMN